MKHTPKIPASTPFLWHCCACGRDSSNPETCGFCGTPLTRAAKAHAQHTPTPWYAGTFDGHEAIFAKVDDEPYAIALMDSGNGTAPMDEILANRDLFLAAPDLLQALREIAEGKGEFDPDPHQHAVNTVENLKAIARAAIAKAERGC